MSTTVDDAPLTTRSARDTIWVYRPELDGLRTRRRLPGACSSTRRWARSAAASSASTCSSCCRGSWYSSILLDEAWSRGTIDLRRFLARRVRRLLPAAVVVVVATVA